MKIISALPVFASGMIGWVIRIRFNGNGDIRFCSRVCLIRRCVRIPEGRCRWSFLIRDHRRGFLCAVGVSYLPVSPSATSISAPWTGFKSCGGLRPGRPWALFAPLSPSVYRRSLRCRRRRSLLAAPHSPSLVGLSRLRCLIVLTGCRVGAWFGFWLVCLFWSGQLAPLDAGLRFGCRYPRCAPDSPHKVSIDDLLFETNAQNSTVDARGPM